MRQIVNSLSDLIAAHSLKTLGELDRWIYKTTDCGGHVVEIDGGVRIHTIVEGSDAEFHQDLMYPFTMKEWNEAWSEMESDADLAWREANEE